ncbi:MAG: xylulokinase [Chloroflexota bacterium]
MAYYIGIDSSTTATKALLMNAQGKVINVASSSYEYETPNPLWSEQDPNLWWQATVQSIQQLLAMSDVDKEAIKGIGLTGQMHGLVLLDNNGRILRPAILWNDQRTGAECDLMRNLIGKERLIDISGNDALTGFTAPKIMWVKAHEPHIYERIAHILLPKDFVRWKLTQTFAMDKAGGSGSQLFDIRRRDWSAELVEQFEINADWLPPTFEGTAVTGQLCTHAADLTGLKVGTPVYGGGGDQAANGVGTGAVKEGIVSLSLGTSGVIFASSDRPQIEKNGRLHTFCHAVPNKWHTMGVMLSAAGCLRWYHDTFAQELDYDQLVSQTTTVQPGCEGLLFLPYLTGERTPYPDPLARGAFVGITVRHNKAHFTRAVLEGVAFGFRDILNLMKSSGLENISQIRASGGGAKNREWRQILADVLQTEVVSINTAEGAAFGAALLAAVGNGQFSSTEEACDELIQITETVAPSKNSSSYDKFYALYHDLYPQLSPTFTQL